MLKTRTISRVVIVDPLIDFTIIPPTADKQYKQAAFCLYDFFLQYPEAYGEGRYEVSMYKTLPKRTLFYDVSKFAA